MDEIQTRLQDTSQNCFKAYAAWVGNKKDVVKQEEMQSAIHELRKVCSRLEIEVALSEREQMTSRPLPIPSHRAAKGRQNDYNDSDIDDDIGNSDAPRQQRRPQQQQMQKRRPQQSNNQQSAPQKVTLSSSSSSSAPAAPVAPVAPEADSGSEE